RFGAGASGRIVQQQVMAAAGLSHELPLLSKWLSKLNFGADHDCLLQFSRANHTNKCRNPDFVTWKFEGGLGENERILLLWSKGRHSSSVILHHFLPEPDRFFP